MRYNLESTLPIDAFSPRTGRSPFSRGMTLEGGGGGRIVKAVSKGLGSVVKGATQAVQAVVQPVYNATLKQIPGVDQALVNVDKAVGKSIPGGWGTVASVATSFLPVSSPLLMGLSKTQMATGLGALAGSGAMRKGGEFNLMGAIAGGALAYGMSNLSEGLQEAGKATPSQTTSDVIANARVESAVPPPGAGSSVTPVADSINTYGLPEVTDVYKPPVPAPSNAVPGQLVPPSTGEFASFKDLGPTPNIPVDKGYGLSSLAQTPSPLTPPAGILDKLASGAGETFKGMGSSIADTGAGIKNLAGFGAQPGTQSAAYNALTSKFGAGSLGATIMGASGLSSLQQQKDMLQQELAQGNIAQEQYNEAVKAIEEQEKIAQETTALHPFNTNPNRDIAVGETYYDRADMPQETLYPKTSGAVYALGGVVGDDYSGLGPLDQGFSFAAGGMPRFLSGGGDGMSDSIPANIEGKQEARLADGEFVIPADVVSHIGNGSSKAGAKQLYSMMDRIRQVRTGTKKQGKQINPRKFMPV